jgi:molybdate transport system ATP-binding protein
MSLHIDIRKKLASFDLEVALDAEAETVGFLGESGCGKSMTMRCIAGIETPDEGSIVVNGKTYFDSAAGINLKTQERKTALLFQNYMLFPHMTVAANILAGVDRKIAPEDKKRILQEQLEHFSLQSFDTRYPLQLSGGQQQRVALARMMAANPGILMLDEPFSALDAHLKALLEQNLVSLFSEFEGTILYVSHDIDEALRFCDRIAVVEDGHIMEIATGRELVRNPTSLAGIKLSGCKNAHPAQKRGDHKIYCPVWGVELETKATVPDDVKAFGVRAFRLSRVDAPGENVYRMRVDRVSDSRFERTALLNFLDNDRRETRHGQMGELQQHLYWRVDMITEPEERWPYLGDDLFIHIPPEALYLVTK